MYPYQVRNEADTRLPVEKSLKEKLEEVLQLDPETMWDRVYEIVHAASPKDLEDPELEIIARKATIKFLSQYHPVKGRFVMLENNLRFMREVFKLPAGIIDEEVVEAAEIGLERSIQALVACKDIYNVGALLFWIEQFTDMFNCKLRELGLEEQRKVSELLLKAAQYGMSNVLDHFFSLFHLFDLDGAEVGEQNHKKEEKEKLRLENLAFKEREAMSEIAAKLDYRAKLDTKDNFALALHVMKVGRLPDLPKEISTSIVAIGERYLKKWEHAEEVYAQVKAALGENDGPEELGQKFFARALGSAPNGTVGMSQRETMIVFEFKMKSDYDTFLEKFYGSDLTKKPSIGRHCFGNTIVVNDKNLKVSVVLIDNSAGVDREKILTHERHHALDTIIDPGSEERNNKDKRRQHLVSEQKIQQLGFQWALEEAAKKMDKDSPFYNNELIGIKIEIMAFLVDGTDPLLIPKTLTSSVAYENLFSKFKINAKTYSELLDTLEMIARRLSDLLSFDNRRDARHRLVYHIKDIPLRRIPKYLEKLDKYRRKTRKGFPFRFYEN